MKAYSVDLRQKVIDAHNQKQGSQRHLAKRFRVSLSFVQNLLKRYRIDGTVEPREHGGGQPNLARNKKLYLSPWWRKIMMLSWSNCVTGWSNVLACESAEQRWDVWFKSLNLPEKKTLHATPAKH